MRLSGPGVLGLLMASAAHGRGLSLVVEPGQSLADGLLSPGQTASFTVCALGEGTPTEPYRMFGALLQFSFGTLGPGQFTHTGQNGYLIGVPGAPGLLYDAAAGQIGIGSGWRFLAVPGAGLPHDGSNPIYLFSFDWTPTTFGGRLVDWTAAAGEGGIYIGDDLAWEYVPLSTIGSASGSFRVVPGPGTAVALGVVSLLATRRRRTDTRAIISS